MLSGAARGPQSVPRHQLAAHIQANIPTCSGPSCEDKDPILASLWGSENTHRVACPLCSHCERGPNPITWAVAVSLAL